jgi:sulfide:quinone oxidoreductase
MPTPSAASDTRPLHVLIAGGGVAAAETLIALRALASERVSITLLSPEADLVYRPMSVVAPFSDEGAHGRPLTDLARDFDAGLERGALAWVAPSAHAAFTADGRELGYDVLVVATGARRTAAFPHALTFRGHEDAAEMRALVNAVHDGTVRRVAFVIPPGTSWTLPLYELALMTAARADAGGSPAALTIATPEERPLAIFGADASAETERLLEAAGIECLCGVSAAVPDGRTLVVQGGRELSCDRVVALPRLSGPAIRGLPADGGGFLRVMPFGRVRGVSDVYGAGDGTSFPIKQGGVACQQADVVAEAIARRAGADVTPTGQRPVLRGELLTGSKPRWLRSDPGDRRGRGAGSEVADHLLWWPPGKVAGKYLAPYLGEHAAFASHDGQLPTGMGKAPAAEPVDRADARRKPRIETETRKLRQEPSCR